jgi:putative aminopeptidase FrvX
MIGGVEVTSIDYSTFKIGTDTGTRSAGSIETDGTHVLKQP